MPVKIMVIDDSFVDLTLIKRAFEAVAPNVSVTYCDDGVDALKRIKDNVRQSKSNTPNICLLDLKMPRISGLDILKELKSHTDTQFISIYMLSSSDNPEDIKNSFDMGCNGYFQKPRRRQDLELMIQSLFNLWEGPARFV